ncbi:MAG: GtrA family protein [Leptospiraceae bacterium]|nr:GtrA family protein [Leptospiraceae bacterium]
MNKDLLNRFIKFLVVGGICTIINYIIFYVLFNYFGVQYLLSSAIGYTSGLVIGYYVNKFWTYQVERDSQEKYMFKYLFVYLASLGASTLFLKFLVEFLNLNPVLANIFAIGLSTITNFVGTNFLVFKNKKANLN